MEQKIIAQIKDFCDELHGSSNYDKEEIFIKGEGELEFAPLSFIIKKNPDIESEEQLEVHFYQLELLFHP